MALRTAHGKGASAGLRVETVPADELKPLSAEDTVAGLASAHAVGRPFTKGNKAAKNKRPTLASSAVISAEATDPDYKRALGWARRYAAARIREMKVAHGGWISSGVAAMLVSSALDLAAGRYLYDQAAKTGDQSTMLAASRLQATGRQQELTALEMASREMETRPKAAPVSPMEQIRRRIATQPIESSAQDETVVGSADGGSMVAKSSS